VHAPVVLNGLNLTSKRKKQLKLYPQKTPLQHNFDFVFTYSIGTGETEGDACGSQKNAEQPLVSRLYCHVPPGQDSGRGRDVILGQEIPAFALKSAAVLLSAKATNTININARDKNTIKFQEEKSKLWVTL
jgi:hypothetical protein